MENIKNKNKEYKKDIFYMEKAIKLAKKGKYTTQPNPNVGCIIVNKKKIVGMGWHTKYGENHAEINAINMAGKLSIGSTAYISLEPCNYYGKTPPCCNKIIQSGIKRVVVSILDPNPKVSGKGVQFLEKAGIKVKVGILSDESKYINKGFFKRMQKGLPWIQVKIASSIDGKIAMENGESKWITSIKSIKDVHLFRAQSSAILSTSETIIQDNPLLTVRNKKKNHLKPIRIIIDSKNRVTPKHRIIQEKGKIWLIRIKKDNKIWPYYVKQILIESYKEKINLIKLFYFLGKKKINIVWIESGSNFSSSLINLKIVDEVIIYIAPKMIGHMGKPMYIINKKIKLNEIPELKFKNIKTIGKDIRLILYPNNKKK